MFLEILIFSKISNINFNMYKNISFKKNNNFFKKNLNTEEFIHYFYNEDLIYFFYFEFFETNYVLIGFKNNIKLDFTNNLIPIENFLSIFINDLLYQNFEHHYFYCCDQFLISSFLDLYNDLCFMKKINYLNKDRFIVDDKNLKIDKYLNQYINSHIKDENNILKLLEDSFNNTLNSDNFEISSINTSLINFIKIK